jgi:hypothetical protein
LCFRIHNHSLSNPRRQRQHPEAHGRRL